MKNDNFVTRKKNWDFIDSKRNEYQSLDNGNEILLRSGTAFSLISFFAILMPCAEFGVEFFIENLFFDTLVIICALIGGVSLWAYFGLENKAQNRMKEIRRECDDIYSKKNK